MTTPNTIMTSQVLTASGNESTGHSVIGDSLAVIINVTAISGTSPSATFSVQWSNDAVNWADASPADAFTPITGIGLADQRFPCKGGFYRLSWQISGTTPSITTTIQTSN